MHENTRKVYSELLPDSPSEKCRQVLNLSFKRADDWHFVFYDDFAGCLAGGFTLDVGKLSFFNDYENCLHTLKLHQVFVANEYRGSGWFKMFMETILSAAEMTGVFLYLCARPYKLNMPTITHPEQYIDWIESEDHYMAMHTDGHYEREQARKLKQTYMNFGFLPLKLNKKDVSKKFWLEQCLCNNPENCCDDVKEALENRITYGIDSKPREQLQDRRSSRKNEKRKARRKHQRNHKRCA